MTKRNQKFARATTAIAAVLALYSTPLLAQEVPTADPVADTTPSDPAPSVDPLAPVSTTETTAPAPSKPKVETARKVATRTTTTTAKRTTVRKAATAAPAAVSAPAPAESTTPPGPVQTEPVPPVATDPGPMPVAQEAAPVDTGSDQMTAEEALPIAGGIGLGLLALGGAGLMMHRRKRRREDEEFEARQHFLDAHEADSEVVEPDFTRQGPVHDPLPERTTVTAKADEPAIPAQGNWESRPDADFMFRRAGKAATEDVTS